MSDALNSARPLPPPRVQALAGRARLGACDAFPYRGNSMRGTFRQGDVLIVEPIPWKAVRPGDVIAFYGASDHHSLIVHRVRVCTPVGLITQGDSNALADAQPVQPDDLVGRVCSFERDGKRRAVQNGRAGLLRLRLLRLWRRVRPLVGWPYRLLRASGVVRRLWRPRVTLVCVHTDAGPVVKYIHRGRAVAWWRPCRGTFECRKPYDLALERPRRCFDKPWRGG